MKCDFSSLTFIGKKKTLELYYILNINAYLNYSKFIEFDTNSFATWVVYFYLSQADFCLNLPKYVLNLAFVTIIAYKTHPFKCVLKLSNL